MSEGWAGRGGSRPTNESGADKDRKRCLLKPVANTKQCWRSIYRGNFQRSESSSDCFFGKFGYRMADVSSFRDSEFKDFGLDFLLSIFKHF